MLTFHANMPALSPREFHRRDMALHLLWAALAGAAAWLFGPGGLLPSFVVAGGFVAAHLLASAALRHWALRRGLPFVPRREWRKAWREAHDAAPVPAILVCALLFGFAVVQCAQGRPAWAFNPQGWAGFGFCAVSMFCFGLFPRLNAAMDAWASRKKVGPGG